MGPKWKPAGEEAGFKMLAYMKSLHKRQHRLGGQSHHEQSAKSRAPNPGGEWPWAISNEYMENSVTVAACAVRNVYMLEYLLR